MLLRPVALFTEGQCVPFIATAGREVGSWQRQVRLTSKLSRRAHSNIPALIHTSSARPQYKEAPDRDSRGILACAVLATGIASRQENRALAVAGALESLPYRIQRTRSPPQLSDEFGSE